MSGKVAVDPLFVGLTRPPLIFGVSYAFAILNILLCMSAYIMTKSFSYLGLLVPVHMLGYILCSKEPLFIELFKVRAEKCSKCKNRFFHGANSYDQF